MNRDSIRKGHLLGALALCAGLFATGSQCAYADGDSACGMEAQYLTDYSDSFEVLDASEGDIVTIEIEDEDVPLASIHLNDRKFDWWWSLLVVASGAAGAEAIRKHRERKYRK